jgi:hypothetical protein
MLSSDAPRKMPSDPPAEVVDAAETALPAAEADVTMQVENLTVIFS